MKYALLGTGSWARSAHGPGLRDSASADLVGVWGRDPHKARTLADDLGTRAWRDVNDLVAEVDAVAIALAPDAQAELACSAARRGKHLLLDKPIALSMEAADRVVEAIDTAGVASVVFFTNRFEAAVQSFLAESSRAGGWRGAQASITVSAMEPGRPPLDSPWRVERGGLWDAAPHAISAVMAVQGPVVGVTAFRDTRGTVDMLIRHDCGATSTIRASLAVPDAAFSWDVTFYGTQGWSTMPAWTVPVPQIATRAVEELEDLVASGTTEHPCDARFARDVLAVVDAAERSISTGRVSAIEQRR